MIKKTKFILPILFAFTLSGCSLIKNIINGGGKKKDSSEDSSEIGPASNDPSHGGDTSISTDSYLWPQAIQDEMMEYLGVVLPFVQLNEETIYSGYEEYPDYYYGLYYIGDDNEVDVFGGYGQKLVNAGFEAVTGDEGETAFFMLVNDAELYVSFGWFEATDTYNAGNEIAVELLFPEGELDSEEDYDSEPYSEENPSEGDVSEDISEDDSEDPSHGDEEDSSSQGSEESLWPSEVAEEMLSVIGEELPFVQLNESTMYHEVQDCIDDYGYYLFCVGDDSENDVVSGVYADLLLDAGYVEGLDAEDEVNYFKEIDGNSVYVYFGYYEATSEYEAGNEIDAYVVPGNGGEQEVPDGSKIDFSDFSTYEETHDDDFGIIACGEFTISVDKGTSSQNVGNGSYWPDNNGAFRFYAGQGITIEWSGDAPSTIVIESNDEDKMLSFGTASITGATMNVSGTTTTLTVTGSSIVITLTKQIRMTTVEFK